MEVIELAGVSFRNKQFAKLDEAIAGAKARDAEYEYKRSQTSLNLSMASVNRSEAEQNSVETSTKRYLLDVMRGVRENKDPEAIARMGKLDAERKKALAAEAKALYEIKESKDSAAGRRQLEKLDLAFRNLEVLKLAREEAGVMTPQEKAEWEKTRAETLDILAGTRAQEGEEGRADDLHPGNKAQQAADLAETQADTGGYEGQYGSR